MIIKIFTSTLWGLAAHIVTVEAKVKSSKRQKFSIVGMGDKGIQESRKRIFTSLDHAGYRMDDLDITINLAPADLRKEGSVFDFPIAVSIMYSLGALRTLKEETMQDSLFFGELSFDGTLRRVRGMISMAIEAQQRGFKRLYVPLDNYNEAVSIGGIEVIGVKSIQEFKFHIDNPSLWTQQIPFIKEIEEVKAPKDFSEIKGQRQAKRMLQIAAAGNHNVLFAGPPGSGKTMLAERLPDIMPDMSFDEIVDTTRIYSLSSSSRINGLIKKRPFRSPHHSLFTAGMIGGGQPPQPGEISLAHNGILFLDELTEFRRPVIEALRQPLEAKTISLIRGQLCVTMPASFLMVTAMNPCPCGFRGDKNRQCKCQNITVKNYLDKLSGPFLDRIDLQLFLQAVEIDDLRVVDEVSTSVLKEKVVKARHAQDKRGITYNAYMTNSEVEKYCILTEDADNILKLAFTKFHMSMRSYQKVLKVSRTIADLEGSEIIQDLHIKEALMYRGIDQKLVELSK